MHKTLPISIVRGVHIGAHPFFRAPDRINSVKLLCT